MVVTTGLSKFYKLGEVTITALQNVNFTLNAGDFTAIVGSSGSGKSTLLNMIGLIDTPSEGEVVLEGLPTSKMKDLEKSALRNEKLGYIFQSFNLVPVLNVFENVELPLLVRKNLTATQRKMRVQTCLEHVGLLAFQFQKPEKLSGGQRQRVAIARALVGEPKLVLADEPTANLDSTTAHSIIDLMENLNRNLGVTFLFSTHDEKLTNRVKKIVRIQDGILQ
jgi:putative ABC transport system ATP-binding protein